jgi:uncharacterized protein YqhQ
MMRGRRAMAIAMRAPDRSIVVHQETLAGIYESRISKIPFLRGLLMLWDALGLGLRALTLSANLQSEENERLEGPKLVLTLAVSLAFAIGVFFLLPAGLGHFSESLFQPAAGPAQLDSAVNPVLPAISEPGNGEETGLGNAGRWTGNLIEGIARLAILIAYIGVIGRVPDIRRVFAYHGAEHKTINAFEAGAELTPENVKRFSLEHPRCGTAFLLTLVILSILVFALVGPLPLSLRLVSRIVMIPALAGLAYEYIRWTARNLDSPLVKILIKPNLALQRLTTREPDLEMLEVSIAAFNAMRAKDQTLTV